MADFHFKRSVFLIFLMHLVIFLGEGCRSERQDISKVYSESFDTILDSLGVGGSILVYDRDKNTFYSNDFVHAEQGFIPASTFKIPNAIIALETGVVESDTAMIFWDGQERYLDLWEQDLTFAEAFRYSCVPCFQEIARRIGLYRMRTYLDELDFGSMDVDEASLDDFWLLGESRVSQFEQVDFLQRLYFSRLPVSPRTTNIVKGMMDLELEGETKWSGKTGLGVVGDSYVGWIVGYAESEKGVFFYATNIQPRSESTEAFAAKRLIATRVAMEQLLSGM